MPLNEYGEKLDSNGYAPSILHDKPVCPQPLDLLVNSSYFAIN